MGQHPPAAGGLPEPGLRHRPDRDADRAGAHRPAGEDLPHVAAAVRRRRVHQSGGPARGAAVAVPAPHQPDGDAHLRADRLLPSSSSPASDGNWGSSDPTAPRPRGARTDGTSSASSICPTDCTRGTRSGSRRCVGTWRPSSIAARTPSSSTPRPSTSWPSATGRSWAASPRSAIVSTTRPTSDRVGFFGFFECIDDQAVADALFAAAADWCRSKGHDVLRGPASFSVNDECGLLVDGFEYPPALMMPHNPPLLRGAGGARRFRQGEGSLGLPGRERRAVRPGARAARPRHRAHPAATRHHHPPARPDGLRRGGRDRSRRSTTPRGRRTGASSP